MVKLTIIERMILSYKQFSTNFVGDSLWRAFLYYIPQIGLLCLFAINCDYYLGPKHAFTPAFILYLLYMIKLTKLEAKLREVESDVKSYGR